jgi:hypothetical protein
MMRSLATTSPRVKLIAALVACIVGGFAAATGVSALLSGNDAVAQDSRTRAPEGDVRVTPKLKRADGPPLGVATYRSEEGRPCFVEGRVSEGRIGSVDKRGTFAPKPVPETAMCVLPGAPVALTMGEDHEDPSRVIVSGLAPAGATRVDVRTPTGHAAATPGEDGAFLVAVGAPQATNVEVRVTHADGAVSNHTLPRRPAPKFDPNAGPAAPGAGGDHHRHGG